MCGIYGTILKDGRKEIDLGIMRALTLANRERGKQSLGFFDSNFDVFKRGDDPIDVLQTTDCAKWMHQSKKSGAWAMVGHTRFGTRGAVSEKNSHPFIYGDVVGSHNGIIEAPKEYTVDSEFMIDKLDQHNSDYQEAFSTEWGYWTTSWYDKRDGCLYISMYDNTCSLMEHEGAWYFSSDGDHLSACIGAKEMIKFGNGQTVRFNSAGELEELPKFESSVGCSYKHDIRTRGGSGKNSGTSYTYNGSGSRGVGHYDGYDNDYGYSDDNVQNRRDSGTTPQLGVVSGTPVINEGLSGDLYQEDESGKWINVNDPEGYVRDYDKEFMDLWADYEHQYDGI